MVGTPTAAVLTAFINGAIAIVIGSWLIETGDGYAKILAGDQFANKWDAAALMGGTASLGLVLEIVDPFVSDLVRSFPPNARAGLLVIGSMLLLNYKVSDFNYWDWRSTTAYLLGSLLIIYPELELQTFADLIP